MKYYGAINDGKDLVTKEYVDSHTGGGLTIDDIYPIGSVYQTLDSTFNPSVRWGGTWSRLQGAFLVGATNPTDSTIYDDTATTVAASSYYTIPISLTSGDVFTVTLSTGAKTMFEYGTSRSGGPWTYAGSDVLWNAGNAAVTVVECSKWFGAADDTATEPISGNALVTLTAEQSGVPQHTHGLTNPTVTSSGTCETDKDGSWSFRNSALLPRTGATGLIGAVSNTTVAKSSTQRYSISNNSNTTAKTVGSIEDTLGHSGHTHTVPNHTHTLSGGSVNNNTATDAVNSHNNMPPYLTVYMWKRIA